MSDVHDFLAARAATGARSDPWAFTGRVEQIAHALHLSRSLPPEGERSQTLLVQGAPGSGKTSLMTHVARLLERDADARAGTCLITSPPRQWDGVTEVYGHLAAMLVGAPAPAGAPTVQVSNRLRAGVGGVGGERVHTRTAPPATFTSAWSIANWHRATGAAEWHPLRRAVVFVDEVHGVSVDSPAAALIEDLHAQAAAPVLLICAGLSNSEKRLEQAGLSRIDHVVTLDCLSYEEAIECVETSLRQALERGVLGTDADAAPWAERIARASGRMAAPSAHVSAGDMARAAGDGGAGFGPG